MHDEKSLQVQIKNYVENAFLTRMLHKNEDRETRKGDARAKLAQTGHGPSSSAWLSAAADIEEDCIAELAREHADLYIEAYGRLGLKIGPEVMQAITEANGNMTAIRKATLIAEAQLTATRTNRISDSHVYARLGSKASIALRDAADKINLYNLAPKEIEPMTTKHRDHLSVIDTPSELHQIAPTLADLKKLPSAQKDRLLLAKLAKMSMHNDSILNKHNLSMHGDPYGMARAYPELERKEVIEHLLAGPWTRLVNDGYLADFTGYGFYKVTTEGHEFLQRESEHAPLKSTPLSTPVTLPARIEGVPRVFLSYSWEGEDHKEWVRGLAEQLQGDGIQVIFDRWYLKLGQDKLHFMESAVEDCDYVAIVCTEEYANRANKREGGVGWESMIITSEVVEHMLTDKFIPILRQGTFKTSLPRYLKTRMGVNLMGDPYNEKEYEELLRKFHGESIAPPPIGAKPDFSKKTTPKPKTFLQMAGEVLANQYKGKLLGPLNKRPNATLHAQYDKPGTPGPWLHVIIRQWNIDGEVKYSLETSMGDEWMGTKDDVIFMFSTFNRKVLKEGYKRMRFAPGTDPDFQSL